MEGIINVVVWAAVIQGFMLGVLYVSSKKYGSFANKLLGFFLFALMMEALSTLFPFQKIGGYSIQQYFTTPEVKLFFPTLFLHYVLEKIGRSGRYRLFLQIHYSLAFLVVIFTVVNLLLFFISGSAMHHFFPEELIESIFYTQQYYAFFLTIIVFVIAIWETLRYREKVRNEYSDFAMLEINWLWQFIFIMAPIIILWGAELLAIVLQGKSNSDIVLATWGFIVVFIYFVSYRAFLHQNLFENKPSLIPEPESHFIDNQEIKSQDGICEKIKSCMESGKYFLDHDLTIHQLAKETGISSRLISTCINKSFGVNFSEWVNNFRVDEAILILRDPDRNHLSIEGAGLEAGFKSRSALYTAFKKKTGQSPGYFRTLALS